MLLYIFITYSDLAELVIFLESLEHGKATKHSDLQAFHILLIINVMHRKNNSVEKDKIKYQIKRFPFKSYS